MKRVRVWVTGIGTISAAGRGNEAFVASLREARRCFSPLEDPRLAGLRASRAGLIHDFPGDKSLPAELSGHDRNTLLAWEAMRQALDSAELTGSLGVRGGVVYGTCSGGMLSIEQHYEALHRGEEILDQRLLFSKRYHGTAKALAWWAGATGPISTVVTACAAGAGAVAQGADFIRAGMADVVLAGGGDAFALSTLAGFDGLKATCDEMCAPFSEPTGLNLGEGAAFFVLEQADHAQRRGANPLAELLGYGLSNDAHHPTAPDPSGKGQRAAMNAALTDAGLDAAQIDYVNAHGTGTRSNDPAESRAIVNVLGDRARQIPVSATKSIIGHCLGGAGALEASGTILAAHAGFVPPTAGFGEPRDGCELDYVSDTARPWRGRLALSNSFGFAGNNACLALDVRPGQQTPAADLPAGLSEPVVITGCGTVSPAGVHRRVSADDPSQWPSVDASARIAVDDPQLELKLVPPLDIRRIDRRLDLKGMDRSSIYAALAVRGALEEAEVKLRPSATAQIGLMLGIATGPSEGEREHLSAVCQHGFSLPSVGAFPYVVPNEVVGNVARALVLRGHNTVLASGAGAGLQALLGAALAVAQRHVETVVAVAADELTPRTVADNRRVGLWGPGTAVIPAEGAAALVVESIGAAARRGATPLAEIVGLGSCSETSGIYTGDREQAARRALEQALGAASIDGSALTLIALGGTASGDHGAEERAVRSLCPEGVPVFAAAEVLGLAEASLPLLQLSVILERVEEGCFAAVLATSPEGLAHCVILRAGCALAT